nr:MAG TPA_asm: hypothetical protein [Microviridae sp.]
MTNGVSGNSYIKRATVPTPSANVRNKKKTATRAVKKSAIQHHYLYVRQHRASR